MVAGANRVSIKITPDTTGFREKLKSELKAILGSLREEVEKTKTELPVTAKNPVDAAFRADIRRSLAEAAKQSVKVPLTPEKEKFRRELAESIKQAERQLSAKVPVDVAEAAKFRQEAKLLADTVSRTVKANIPVEVDETPFTRAKKALLSTRGAASGLSQGMAELAGTAAKAGLAILAINGAVSLASTWGPLLASSVGVLALVPGIAVAAVAGLVAIKLGADGIKKAFDPVKGEFATIKTAASNTFQKTLTPVLAKLATTVPTLRDGFAGVTRAVTAGAPAMASFAVNANRTGQLSSIFALVAQAIRNVSNATAPLIAAFIRIAQIGLQVFAPLTDGAANAATAFNNFVQSAAGAQRIRDFIQGGLNAFRALWQVLQDVGTIVVTVFQALQLGGAGVGGVFGGAVSSVRQFVTSVQGIEILKEIGTLIRTVAQDVGGLFVTALREIGPSVRAILPGLTQLAGQITSVLIPSFKFLGPIITTLFTFISGNIGWIGPLVIGITAVAAAMALLNAAMDAGPIGVVLAILGLLVLAVTTVITYWKPIVHFFEGVWNSILSAFTPVGNFFSSIGSFFGSAASAVTGAFNSVVSFFQNLPGRILGALGGLVSSIGAFFVSLGTTVANGASAAWNWLVTSVQQAAQASVTFLLQLPQKIAYAIGYIAGLGVRLGGQLWNFLSDTVPKAINDAVNWLLTLPGRVGSFFAGLGNQIYTYAVNAWHNFVNATVTGTTQALAWVNALPGKVIAFLSNLGTRLVTLASQAWHSFVNTSINTAVSVLTWVNALPGRVIGFLSSLGSRLGRTAVDAWHAFLRGMVDVGNAVFTFVASIPGRIGRFFANAGNFLYHAGADILNGLLNGIASIARSVVNYVSNLGHSLIRGFKDAVGIASPSKPMRENGVFFMGGFNLGVKSSARQVYSTLAKVADNVIGVMSNLSIGRGLLAGIEAQKGALQSGVINALVPSAAQVAPAAAAMAGGIQSAVSASTLGVSATLNDPTLQVAGIGEQVNAALAEWGVVIDQNGIAKLVNNANKKNARR